MPYDARIVKINLDSDEAIDLARSIRSESQLQLCALARDSLDEVRSWFPQQCQDLPTRQIRMWDARSKKTLIIFPNENFVKNSCSGIAINWTVGYMLIVALVLRIVV